MDSTQYLIAKVYLVLSDISHPIEGTIYLFLLAVIFRWRWPIMWNNFLKIISAPTESKIKPEDTKSQILSQSIPNDSSESNESANSK